MPNKKTVLYNYRSPRDYKVFNMGNKASPPFQMKGMSFGNSSVTPEMMQQLDTQITEMKKLGKHGAAQALIDKKSKLMDSMKKDSMATKKYKY